MQADLEKEDLKVAVFLVLEHDGVRSDKSRGVNKLSYTVRVDRRDVWTTSYPTFPRHTDTHHLYTRHTINLFTHIADTNFRYTRLIYTA